MVGPPPPPPPELAAALVRELRLARRAKAARLVEYMADQGETPVEEIARPHGFARGLLGASPSRPVDRTAGRIGRPSRPHPR